jgi:hypothetical protein
VIRRTLITSASAWLVQFGRLLSGSQLHTRSFENRKRARDHMSDNQQQVDSPLHHCDVHFDIVCHSISVSILILQDTPQSNVAEVFDLDSSKYRIIGLDYSKTKFGVDGLHL